MDSILRPREIQARIRSGQTPETVAEAAQTSVERIIGYATPVLAERAHIAERAQHSSVRRFGDGAVGHLGDAVTSRLQGCAPEATSVEWDAWRREDGRWAVVAEYRTTEGPRRAEFGYDVAGRYAVAEDDEARWLIGEDRRGATVPLEDGLQGLGEQTELGDDAIEVVTGHPPVALFQRTPPGEMAEVADEEPTSDLTETADAVRQLAGTDALFEPTEVSARTTRPTVRPGRPRSRSSMPSWDDIMLGSARGPE